MLEFMLNPATTELIWTLSVTTLLMVAGGLTILIMPWKCSEGASLLFLFNGKEYTFCVKTGY
jgi:hypothetical protein